MIIPESWLSILGAGNSSVDDEQLFFRARDGANLPETIGKRNGMTAAEVEALNPGVEWPVAAGQSVRIQ